MTVSFEILRAEAAPPALRLHLTVLAERPVVAVSLHAQAMIEPAVRIYDDAEREALKELFGVPERWGSTTQPFLLEHADTQIGPFEESAAFAIDLPFPQQAECGAVRYLQRLDGGDVAVALHFTGRVQHADGIVQISWDACARARIAVAELAPLLAGARETVPGMDDVLAELGRAR